MPKAQDSKSCPACGAPNLCQAGSEVEKCWCMNFPKVLVVENAESCLCEKCLESKLLER